MNIPSLEELRAPFAGLKTGALRDAADEAGIPFTTFWKVVRGEVANPRIDTVRALAAYVQRRNAATKRAAKKAEQKA